MSFVVKKAVREKINLLFAISGASGSGKTYSALLLAQGIAGENGKIAVIDTEAGRSLQYAPKNGEQADPTKGTFDFLHLDFQPPFSPERYIEAIKACEDNGATVIVIDSASHEWNGEGGVAETAEQTALSRATNKDGSIDYKKLESVKLLSWANPKKEHKRMMAKLTQIRSHVIFCLRAEDKVKMVFQYGKSTITPVGFQPICEKGFMFEMTASFTMDPTNPGKPNYEFDKKLNDDMQAIFKNGESITIEHGIKLKQWAESGCDAQVDKAFEWISSIIQRVNNCQSQEQLETITKSSSYINGIKKIREERPELFNNAINAIQNKLASFNQEAVPNA